MKDYISAEQRLQEILPKRYSIAESVFTILYAKFLKKIYNYLITT